MGSDAGKAAVGVLDHSLTAFRRGARLTVSSLVLVVGLGLVAHAQADNQSTDGPFLRIDVGMHSAACVGKF